MDEMVYEIGKRFPQVETVEVVYEGGMICAVYLKGPQTNITDDRNTYISGIGLEYGDPLNDIIDEQCYKVEDETVGVITYITFDLLARTYSVATTDSNPYILDFNVGGM